MTTVAYEPALAGMRGTLSVLSAAAQHAYSGDDLAQFLANRNIVSDTDLALLAAQAEALHVAVQHEVTTRKVSFDLDTFLSGPIDQVDELVAANAEAQQSDEPENTTTTEPSEPDGQDQPEPASRGGEPDGDPTA